MVHFAKKHEHVWICSMGKKFRMRAITTTVDEANHVMEMHSEVALIACLGDFCILANQYEGLRDGE